MLRDESPLGTTLLKSTFLITDPLRTGGYITHWLCSNMTEWGIFLHKQSLSDSSYR